MQHHLPGWTSRSCCDPALRNSKPRARRRRKPFNLLLEAADEVDAAGSRIRLYFKLQEHEGRMRTGNSRKMT